MRRAPLPSVMDSTGSVGPTVMRRQFFWTYKVKTGNCEVVRAPVGEGGSRNLNLNCPPKLFQVVMLTWHSISVGAEENTKSGLVIDGLTAGVLPTGLNTIG